MVWPRRPANASDLRIVEASFPDGSRLCACFVPLLRGRRSRHSPLQFQRPSLEDMVRLARRSTPEMAEFMTTAVRGR